MSSAHNKILKNRLHKQQDEPKLQQIQQDDFNQSQNSQFFKKHEEQNNNHYKENNFQESHVQTNQKQTIQSELEYYDSIKSPECFIRFTSKLFPKTKLAKQRSQLDLGIHFQPMNQTFEIPLASFNKNVEIVRCSNCAAYMNPYVQFKNEGFNWDCNLCHSSQKTPDTYYSKLDKNGRRLDAKDKVELHQCSYDIIATEKFMSKPPQQASFIFLLDVSNQNSQNNKLLNSFCNTLRHFVENPEILGACAQITLYDCSARFNQPHMLILTDPDINFIAGDFLFEIQECQDNLLFLLEMLPIWHTENKNRIAEDVMGKTINLANHYAEEFGGHIYLFQDSNVSKESILNFSNVTAENSQNFYKPSHTHYKTISEENAKNGLYYHIFMFSSQFKNILTLGELSKQGNGNLFYYDHNTQFEQFESEFYNCLNREQSYDSHFRIRLSFGWGKDSIIGNFTNKVNDLLS